MIGRKDEIAELQQIVESREAQFVVVYGRRRVGKTYLVREFFANRFAFYHTGMANNTTKEQLHAFNASLNKYGTISYPQAGSWFDAFQQLINLLANSRKRGKKVVFIDEMPWLDANRSGFVTALEYFWNSWASARNDMVLIACGSASSWITNKIINNHGGLHNRVTHQLYLEPFTLAECEEYFTGQNIEMSRYEILESYMIHGGIPYYLSFFKKAFSMAQNIDNMFFNASSSLKNEFANLYASLFKNHDAYIKIVEALSVKTKGLTRKELLATAKLPDGGNFTRVLADLEMCGFIRKYRGFEKKERSALYQLCDFYTLFYFRFLKDYSFDDEHFWSHFIESGTHNAWAGYAFEQVCLAHIRQIKSKLGISGVLTRTASWRSADSENDGAQIDLLIERNDNVINLCEMKYANDEYVIDQEYDKILRNKRSAFRAETGTKKALHITMVTTYGVKRNKYYGSIQSEITANDLFM